MDLDQDSIGSPASVYDVRQKWLTKKVTNPAPYLEDSLWRVDNAADWKLGQLDVFKKKIIAFFPLLSFIFCVIKNLGSGSRTSNCYTFVMKV
jgi:hypothetical protein